MCPLFSGRGIRGITRDETPVAAIGFYCSWAAIFFANESEALGRNKQVVWGQVETWDNGARREGTGNNDGTRPYCETSLETEPKVPSQDLESHGL